MKYFDWFKINLKDFHWLDVNYFYLKTFEKHPEGGSGSIITLLHIHPPVTTATAEGDRLASAPASGVDKQANAAPKTRNNVVKKYIPGRMAVVVDNLAHLDSAAQHGFSARDRSCTRHTFTHDLN